MGWKDPSRRFTLHKRLERRDACRSLRDGKYIYLNNNENKSEMIHTTIQNKQHRLPNIIMDSLRCVIMIINPLPPYLMPPISTYWTVSDLRRLRRERSNDSGRRPSSNQPSTGCRGQHGEDKDRVSTVPQKK
jgi:hypothetical protein